MADSEASSSTESDSDEEFLTLRADKGIDREALVRKKLLESFYGPTAVVAAPSSSFADSDEDGDSPTKASPEGGNDDLDSPYFDAEAHTRRHLEGSSMQTLLETEERLALQVRTLDSTMQTLVYENYSRFIDATDAIRSIGVNVQANEAGLERLTRGMHTIDEQSKAVEDALGSLREQVAEKIRVKRLLTRLDALLKLPHTLREQIEAGKYKKATKSYLSASSILSKHSEGFESLKNIETECNSILEHMKADLNRKLVHWSGRYTSSHENSVAAGNDDNAIPDPPMDMNEIFECAGALFILHENDADTLQASDQDADEIQSMTLSASMRLLDRLLDVHMIDVQERRFAGGTIEPGLEMNLGGGHAQFQQLVSDHKGVPLIPNEVLDGILEAASSYGSTFVDQPTRSSDLKQFISEAFSSFLIHVRAILLEESAVTTFGDDGQDDADYNQEQVNSSLSILVQSVEGLASGLSLPAVGINAEFTASLVEQVSDLVEAMIRRRVDQQFLRLRQLVVRDCLVPFVDRAMSERAEAIATNKRPLDGIVQIADSTLSDCLQLVDDTIRSIFNGGGADLSDSTSPDVVILKDAIHTSTYRFASWLASAFEILAGGESSDPDQVVEASINYSDDAEGMNSDLEGRDLSPSRVDVAETLGDKISEDSSVLDLIVDIHKKLLSADDRFPDIVHSDYVLSIAEMCRRAQESVSENLEQSILNHVGGSKKKPRGLFPTDGPAHRADQDNMVYQRFKAASNRLMVLYATNRGSMAADILCSDLPSLAQQDVLELTAGPRTATWDCLEIAKQTSLECSALLGEKPRAGPIPDMEIDKLTLSSSLASRKTGLQLDIERMFKEKIDVYPHPSAPLEPSRNMIIFIALKVAFRGLLELSRASSFTAVAYRQLCIDAVFLKVMIGHYICDEFAVHGSNACTSLSSLLDDVMLCVAERCTDAEIDEDNVRQEAKNVVSGFIIDMDVTGISEKFTIAYDG